MAYSYALHHVKAGDEIVVSIMEHHSNMLPWQMVASQTGATLRYMDCEPNGTLTDETIEQTIGKKTKLVAIGHVSNVLGCVNPVKRSSTGRTPSALPPCWMRRRARPTCRWMCRRWTRILLRSPAIS